jgi:long-chain acyl-CoA synthetase
VATTTGTGISEAARAALGAGTLCEAFQITAAANATRPALRTATDDSISWGEYAARVRALAGGLAALGVGDGDTVAILLSNCREFHLVDTATVHLGAAPYSIYHTNPPEQIVPLLANSGARVLVTEPIFLERARAARELHPSLEHLVIVGARGEHPGELGFDELQSLTTPGFDFEATWRRVTPDHVATLVYTSGTTGLPKGVEHTHRGLVFGLGCLNRLAPVSPEGRCVSYLPMAHIAERYISHYSSLAFGYTITVCPDPKQLAAAIRSSRPTRFFGVPRIYEKFAGAARAMIESGGKTEALEAGLAVVRAQQSGEAVPLLGEDHARTLAGVREALGLDQLEWAGVAAAPSPYAVLEFFHAIGVNVAELWGMSECVLSTSNPPARVKLGTVGVAIPGVEIALADDGEILVRGPNVFKQYRNEPERTAEALDADGWLHSGDIAIADEDGYLKIVDRKKELIINSAGKNMSPTHIEMMIKEESPLIGQVVAIGEGRQYVTALIVLDEDGAARLREQHGLPNDVAALAAHPYVREHLEAAVNRGNERLARVEQIKAFHVVPEYWQPGTDQLTPTMKLKRRVIDKLYAKTIDGLYAA